MNKGKSGIWGMFQGNEQEFSQKPTSTIAGMISFVKKKSG